MLLRAGFACWTSQVQSLAPSVRAEEHSCLNSWRSAASLGWQFWPGWTNDLTWYKAASCYLCSFLKGKCMKYFCCSIMDVHNCIFSQWDLKTNGEHTISEVSGPAKPFLTEWVWKCEYWEIKGFVLQGWDAAVLDGQIASNSDCVLDNFASFSSCSVASSL